MLKVCEIFPSIQGEGIQIGTPMTFIRLSGCNLRCKWCLDGETPILLADFTWKPLKDIQIGDEIVSIRRFRKGGHLHFVKSEVIGKKKLFADTLKLKFGDKEIITTPDHKFLATEYREFWQNAESLKGKELHFIPPIEQDTEFQRGWFKGFVDGDGSLTVLKDKYLRLTLAQKRIYLLDRFCELAQLHGFNPRRALHKGGIRGTVLDCIEWTGKEVEEFVDYISNHETNQYMRGWLAGFYDAEGWFDNSSVRLAQLTERHRETAIHYATKLGFRVNVQPKVIILSDAMRFFSECRPYKEKTLPIGIMSNKLRVKVTNISDAGYREVYDLGTTAGNFIANGLIVHNCDTKYAWTGGTYMEEEDIVETVKQWPNTWICITGGEPFLQNLERLLELLSGYQIAVETNGTLPRPEGRIDMLTISPKLSNSRMLDKLRPDILCSLLQDTKQRKQLKFVCETTADVNEALQLCEKLEGEFGITISSFPVVFQPQGLARSILWLSTYLGKLRILWEYIQECQKEHPFWDLRVLPQLHRLLYGSRGGV